MRKLNFYLLIIILVFTLLASCQNNDPIEPPDEFGLNYNDLLSELNFARTNPKEYVKLIEALLPSYNGSEGKVAIEEAIASLKSQQSIPPLSLNDGINKAAKYHCNDQGKTGEIGHYGSKGETPATRMYMYGTYNAAGENIYYGPNIEIRKMIIAFIIDDGVSDRGHRINIYNPIWTDVGFGWGKHPSKYGMMCVIDFAKDYKIK